MVEFQDAVIVGVVLFSIALGLVIVHMATGMLVTDMISKPIINDSNTTVQVLQDTQDLTNRFDYIIFGVLMGLIFAAIIGGYLAGGAHPILMFIYFIIMVIAVVTASLMSYIWNEQLGTLLNNTISTSFPIADHIVTYLPIYVAAIAFVSLIIMFSRKYMEG